MTGIKSRLLQWGVGKASGRDRTGDVADTVVLLDSAEQLPTVLESDLVTDGSTVFVPGTGDLPTTTSGPAIHHYQGSAAATGGELCLGDDFFLQIQAYGISEFMSVVGPTLVRVDDGTDFDSYLRDADVARTTGQFQPFMTNPVVHLADVSALGAEPADDGPSVRLHVDEKSYISTSPAGAKFGRLGKSTSAELENAWQADPSARVGRGSAIALGLAVEESYRGAQVASRPWLGRYLSATHAVRHTLSRGIPSVQVSGFGQTLSPKLVGHPPIESAQTPLILWSPESAYLFDPVRERLFEMNQPTATVLEAILTCGTQGAREFVGEAAASQGELLLARFGLRTGYPSQQKVAV